MKYFFIILAAFMPSIGVAVVVTDVFSLQQLIFSVLGQLALLFFPAIIAFFIFGVVKFIKNADDPKEREAGKQFMIWAIIAITVLTTLWGLVGLLTDTLGVTTGGVLDYVDKNGSALTP